MTEWIVTPEVIDIIAQLKGLREGDEIQFAPNDSRNAHGIEPGMVCTIVAVLPKASMSGIGTKALWDGAKGARILGVLTHGAAGLKYFTRENIAAWRRPKLEGP